MLGVTVHSTGIDELLDALDAEAQRLPREVQIAINATAKKARSFISREIREELAVKAKDVNGVLKISKRATKTDLTAKVKLNHQKRFSLKTFGARHTRAGVSYKVRKSEGRRTIKDAFMGPRPGATAVRLRGHAYKRLGRKRYPIVFLKGGSPWGAYVTRNIDLQVLGITDKELRKQIDRRIRLARLRASGVVK